MNAHQEGEGCLMMSVIVVSVLLALWLGYSLGAMEGRCAERWHAQKTYADTLITLRSGCELP
jgi:hypothetical protein